MDKIEEMRQEIDLIDTQLLVLLRDRFKKSCGIGELKWKHGIEALDSERWQSLLEDRARRATGMDLDKDLVIEIFEIIHRYSIKQQEGVINESC